MPGRGPGFRKAFSALSLPVFRVLLISQFLAMLTWQMSMVTRGVLVWDMTGSYAITGLLSFAFGIPMLSFSLIGGAVADRVDKRLLTIGCQSVSATIALATGIMVATDIVTIPYLFTMGLIEGTMFAFMMPARQALMREFVPDAQFANAIALGSGAASFTTIIGPAFAGGLIAVAGIPVAYFAIATAGGLAAVQYLRLPASRTHVLGTGARREGLLTDVRAGFSYVFNSAFLRLLMVMAFVPAMFAMPYAVLLPGFSDVQLGDDRLYSVLMTLSGVGSLCGSFAVAMLADVRRKVLLQLLFGVGIASGLVMFGAGTMVLGRPAAFLGAFILGASMISYQTINNTLLMTASDPKMIGRVMSILMLAFSAIPLAGYPLGVLGDLLGADVLLAIMGLCVAAGLAIIALLNPNHALGDSMEAASEWLHHQLPAPSEPLAGDAGPAGG